MKFKFIFMLFNIILLLFMAVIIILPLYMIGPAYSASIWQYNWPLIGALTLLFLGFNTYYFTNRTLFYLLEREDWPALVRHLEDKVIQKGRYSTRLVRLLANSYLVLSDSGAVMSLENKTAMAKPSLVDSCALIFGTARILGGDISGAIRFFEARKDTAKAESREWVRWYHGFSLLLNSQFEEAGEKFSVLARISRDGVITALSSYFLYTSIAPATAGNGADYVKTALEGRERVRKTLPKQENWKSLVSKLSTEIHAAAISKYLDETGKWLYLRPIPEKTAPEE